MVSTLRSHWARDWPLAAAAFSSPLKNPIVGSAGVVEVLYTRVPPSSSLTRKSVNVPPTSTPIRIPMAILFPKRRAGPVRTPRTGDALRKKTTGARSVAGERHRADQDGADDHRLGVGADLHQVQTVLHEHDEQGADQDLDGAAQIGRASCRER